MYSSLGIVSGLVSVGTLGVAYWKGTLGCGGLMLKRGQSLKVGWENSMLVKMHKVVQSDLFV